MQGIQVGVVVRNSLTRRRHSSLQSNPGRILIDLILTGIEQCHRLGDRRIHLLAGGRYLTVPLRFARPNICGGLRDCGHRGPNIHHCRACITCALIQYSSTRGFITPALCCRQPLRTSVCYRLRQRVDGGAIMHLGGLQGLLCFDIIQRCPQRGISSGIRPHRRSTCDHRLAMCIGHAMTFDQPSGDGSYERHTYRHKDDNGQNTASLQPLRW